MYAGHAPPRLADDSIVIYSPTFPFGCGVPFGRKSVLFVSGTLARSKEVTVDVRMVAKLSTVAK